MKRQLTLGSVVKGWTLYGYKYDGSEYVERNLGGKLRRVYLTKGRTAVTIAIAEPEWNGLKATLGWSCLSNGGAV